MTKGILIFAHNNRAVDYALMATVAGGLAKKHLGLPVSLVTDPSTLDWCKESGNYKKLVEVFDQIIQVDRPVTDNMRNLHDGVHVKAVPFVNSNRSNAWNLTPYDKTLLIDSDYLIFSDRLNTYWDVPEDVMIAKGMLDIYDQKRLGYLDKYVSDTGVHMYWATNVMFTKSDYSKAFFDLVDHIRENYKYYADLFRFGTTQFRNDIAFSVAKHILNGYATDTSLSLPPVLTAIDKDVLYKVSDDGKLTFLVSPMGNSDYFATAIRDIDIHVMNKQSIIRNIDELEKLI